MATEDASTSEPPEPDASTPEVLTPDEESQLKDKLERAMRDTGRFSDDQIGKAIPRFMQVRVLVVKENNNFLHQPTADDMPLKWESSFIVSPHSCLEFFGLDHCYFAAPAHNGPLCPSFFLSTSRRLHLHSSPTPNALPNPHEPSKQMKLLKEGGSEVTHEMILKLTDEVGGAKHYQRLPPCRLSRDPFVIPSLDRLRRRNC